jgi:hypothetical protein
MRRSINRDCAAFIAGREIALGKGAVIDMDVLHHGPAHLLQVRRQQDRRAAVAAEATVRDADAGLCDQPDGLPAGKLAVIHFELRLVGGAKAEERAFPDRGGERLG